METAIAATRGFSDTSPNNIIQIPDPARVAIVKRGTYCTEQKAVKVTVELDEYDRQSQTKPAQIRHRKACGSVRLPDVLKPIQAGMISAGYPPAEAAQIVKDVFINMSAAHGGKRLYIQKMSSMENSLKNLET